MRQAQLQCGTTHCNWHWHCLGPGRRVKVDMAQQGIQRVGAYESMVLDRCLNTLITDVISWHHDGSGQGGRESALTQKTFLVYCAHSTQDLGAESAARSKPGTTKQFPMFHQLNGAYARGERFTPVMPSKRQDFSRQLNAELVSQFG